MNCTFKSVLHIVCLILKILRNNKEKGRHTGKLGKQRVTDCFTLTSKKRRVISK